MTSKSNKTLEEQLEDLTENFDQLYENVDAFFILTMGILVFLMQGGFAFLEAGAVR